MQAVADVQDTSLSWLYIAPVGLGMESADQVVPFQDASNVTPWLALLKDNPTAVQALGEVHDTPRSKAGTAPGGFGEF
jgi:hypothetical protein